MNSCQQNVCRIFWDFLPRLKIIQAADTTQLNHGKERKERGRETERGGVATTHRHWHKLCQKRLALSLEAAARSFGRGKKAAHFGSVYCWARGAGAVGPPLKRLFGIPHIFMFLRSLPIWPPHPSLTCPAPSAETLTPNEKRQQIIHHFAFRLASISSGKSCATQLGYCSRWRWLSAPTHNSPAPPSLRPSTGPFGVGGKNIIWNGLSSILCAIFLLFPFLFIFFSSTFFFACLRFAFCLLCARRPRLL